MRSESILVSPELAKEWLSRSAGNPRYGQEGKVNRSVVTKYASDMKKGRWQLTHQGIAFNEDGALVDGHHRLRAVIESGVPVMMYVTYGVSDEASLLDVGYSRTPSQIMAYSLHADKAIASSNIISIAKLHMYFLCGEDRHKSEAKSSFEIMEFILNRHETFKFVSGIQNLRKDGRKPLRNASVGHAIFCALSCGVPNDVISNFCNVFLTGFPKDDTEYAAIVAKNEMQLYSRRADTAFRAYQSKYIQTCIRDFSFGIKRVRRYKNPEAIYTEMMIKENL